MMSHLKKILSFFYFDTFGNIAVASFLICAASGVLLAVPFNPSAPYNSLTEILLFDKYSSFVRNLHFWSAQLFLVFTLLHIYDHFKLRSEKRVKKGVWLRLTISLLFTFYAMLSGFILKGDIESEQAKRIIIYLLELFPFIGESISVLLFGPENDFQILYIQHVGLATIFLAVIIVEHGKTFWSKISTFIYTLTVTVFLSLAVVPGLHDGKNPIVKGPWYFVGIQEILHWINLPLVILVIFSLLLLIFYLINIRPAMESELYKKIILYSFSLYFLISVFAYFFRGENWEVVNPFSGNLKISDNLGAFSFSGDLPDSIKFDAVPNNTEGCLICHGDVEGFSKSHNPEAIGCVSCHLGNKFTLNKEKAHAEMISIPGNLEDALRTCGTSECHPEIIPRVNNSIMTTLSGMISVNKFVFGEISEPSGLERITEIGHSPAESHLRNLCASCHIGNEKIEFGPISEESRGGGCSACHLNYSDSSFAELKLYDASSDLDDFKFRFHPSLDLNVSNDHCFGCHSRSGRISASYEGWHETTLEQVPENNKSKFRKLADERIFEFVKEDIHHQKGMECIDCHLAQGIMGDGEQYQHKEEQVKIRCIDCHSPDLDSIKYKDIDDESKKIAQVRGISNSAVFLLSGSNVPILNTFHETDSLPYLVTKQEKKKLGLLPPDQQCTAESHKRLACNACHTAWAPQCIGCHTEYDPASESFDLLENEEINGEWVEHIGDFFAEPPVLGISIMGDSSGACYSKVTTFILGMIMTIDTKEYSGDEDEIFRRLYSPISAHTTSAESRTCRSCHNNPLAIGYGRGSLKYSISGKNGIWMFAPKYRLRDEDNLPEDAWIGFLTEPGENLSTRTGARPFTLEEQNRILLAGSCLVCHEENSNVIRSTLENFDNVLQRVSKSCVLPASQ